MRNGYLPKRTTQTELLKIPKVRDKSESEIKFNSELIPPYLKPTTCMNVLPVLYLKGLYR